VTRRAFDDFLRGQDLLRRFPAIGLAGVVEDFRDDERDAVVRRVRADVAASGLPTTRRRSSSRRAGAASTAS
jgi:hypothetical protein